MMGATDAQLASDRELLIRIDERVADLHIIVKGNGSPGLVERVDSLEADRDKIKGLTYVGGAGGFFGFLAGLWHLFASFIHGK